jgi:SpoIIAA-like
MIEPLSGLPDGVLGFRFSGHVTKQDYDEVLAPALMQRITDGAMIRLAIVIGEDFDRFEASAMWEDMKFGFGSGVTHPSLWDRTALISNHDWVEHAMSLFGWMMLGDAREYPMERLDEAIAWLGA